MDAVDLESEDCITVTVFKTLEQCKAVVPIVTRGYANSLQCLRELYYVKLKHRSAQLHPIVLEYGWEHEAGGQWLRATLSEVNSRVYHCAVEANLKEVAMNIAKVCFKEKTVIEKGITESIKDHYRGLTLTTYEWIQVNKFLILKLLRKSKGKHFIELGDNHELTPVAYNDIFRLCPANFKDKGPIKKVLLEGGAGIGKRRFAFYCVKIGRMERYFNNMM